MENPDAAADPQTCCPIVELRQYTLHPGQRDVLIDLFDREFVESQEALGMKVIGQFRDLDNPNRFVWLRGFRDMPSRAQALKDFYGGPVWKAHREAANATMIDSNNVLLLHPATPTSGFSSWKQGTPSTWSERDAERIDCGDDLLFRCAGGCSLCSVFRQNSETGRDWFRRNGPGVFRDRA